MVALHIRPPTVLVVEDDAFVRMMATDIVEELGYAMFEATSADEAIAILELHDEITIVFTDIHMAGSMNGLELAALTRLRLPAVGFVIVSGEHQAETSQMPAGAKFFAKPYNPAVVRDALRHMSEEIDSASDNDAARTLTEKDCLWGTSVQEHAEANILSLVPNAVGVTEVARSICTAPRDC